MQRSATGTWQTVSAGREVVRAFVPAPLPPNPPLDIAAARQQKLEQALVALGRLDAITTLLPEPDIFLYAYVRREAVLSSQIEGTQSSLSDLLLFELDEAAVRARCPANSAPRKTGSAARGPATPSSCRLRRRRSSTAWRSWSASCTPRTAPARSSRRRWRMCSSRPSTRF